MDASRRHDDAPIACDSSSPFCGIFTNVCGIMYSGWRVARRGEESGRGERRGRGFVNVVRHEREIGLRMEGV